MTDAEQPPKKPRFQVGDIVVSADGGAYVGEVTYISKEEDVVRHRCRRTGTESTKSYFGFFCRYMTIQDVITRDMETSRENLALLQENDKLRRADAGRTRYCEACLNMSIRTMDANKALADAVQERDAAREALRKLLLSRDAAWSGGHDWEEAVDEAICVLGATGTGRAKGGG
jgi:hypothetical protein